MSCNYINKTRNIVGVFLSLSLSLMGEVQGGGGMSKALAGVALGGLGGGLGAIAVGAGAGAVGTAAATGAIVGGAQAAAGGKATVGVNIPVGGDGGGRPTEIVQYEDKHGTRFVDMEIGQPPAMPAPRETCQTPDCCTKRKLAFREELIKARGAV